MELERSPMNMKIKKYDDLTVINGIGPARQDWLRNKLGVLKYQNLAGLSPEELLVHLKKDNLIASRNEVNRWISKAQELADANKTSVQGEWAPFASFVVEFQARRGNR